MSAAGRRATVLADLGAPIVLAPLAGGPATPALAAAVSEAGGLGFLAAGYLDAAGVAAAIGSAREMTGRPIGVNVFSPVPGPADPAGYADYLATLERWAAERGLPLGEPRFGDDDHAAKIGALEADPVAVVSFTFGCPATGVVERLQRAGSEVWVTVTTPEEAATAVAAGADALVVQGHEAGGHQGSFADADDEPRYGLLALLQLIAAAHPELPLVAAGGIATGAGVAAVLCAGARAAQLGTAFMLCAEAGTAPAHRTALRSTRPTALTRAYTGRTARGIRNAFMDAHDAAAPRAYPEIHFVTAPLRRVAREAGDEAPVNLWAGQAHALARELPAGDLVTALANEADAALGAAAAVLARG